jgi:hypothetical protein
MADIILFMAASFSERYEVSSGKAASVAVEQIENGEIAKGGRLSRPATKAAAPTTATIANNARQEIDAGKNDDM